MKIKVSVGCTARTATMIFPTGTCIIPLLDDG